MELVKANINDLRAVLITRWPDVKRLVRLEDTPHYQFLLGNRQPYIDYLKIANQPDHSVEKFDRLINDFDIEKSKFIRCYPDNQGKWIIADGFHRACIMLFKGIFNLTIET
jgi:hypothetical protein